MFNFFKKDKKKKEEIIEQELSAQEKEELENKIKQKLHNINETSEQEEKAKSYEEMGLLQAELGDIDEAIASLEKSLDLELSIGNGYKKLMSLYNQKRAEAAKMGSDEGIEFYMNKMDEMRQIAKKMTISGQ